MSLIITFPNCGNSKTIDPDLIDQICMCCGEPFYDETIYEESFSEALRQEALDPQCRWCGCDELHACDDLHNSGLTCRWSEYFARRGLWICTSCETIAITLELNLGALALWRQKAMGL